MSEPDLTRRSFIKLACYLSALPVLSILPGCVQSRPLKVASHVWPGYEFMFLAQNLGYLNSNLVQLTETLSASSSLERLLAKEVDGAALTLDEVLMARSRGVKLSIVQVFDISAGADMVMARPGITRPRDLKGKTIGVETGALGEVMLHHLLQASEMKKTDVRVVASKINQHLSDWKSNQLDAVITYQPVASQLAALGARNIFDSRSLPNTILDVLAIREDALILRDGLRHLIACHFKGQQHYLNNHVDAIYRMSERLALPVAEVDNAFRGLILPDLRSNHKLLFGEPSVVKQTARKISTIMVEVGMLSKEDDLHELIKPEFLSTSLL